MNRWRLVIVLVPALLVVCLAVGALQSDPDVLRVPAVYVVLAVAGLLGWLVAWLSARALRAAPLVTIAQAMAQPGRVSIQGKARMPAGRQPLRSMTGRPCVWFTYRQRDTTGGSDPFTRNDDVSGRRHNYKTHESSRPFVIADATGQCLVLPAGAEIRAGHLDETSSHRERAIVEGDDISIYGQLRPFSPDAAPAEGSDGLSAGAQRGIATQAAQLSEASGLAPATVSLPPLPTLPTIGQPDGHGLFIIVNGTLEGEGGLLGLAGWLNVIIMLAAVGALVWLHAHPLVSG